MADYTAHHYHQPSDEYKADWDFRGNAKLARFGFVLGWLASGKRTVEWNPGDEYEAPRLAAAFSSSRRSSSNSRTGCIPACSGGR